MSLNQTAIMQAHYKTNLCPLDKTVNNRLRLLGFAVCLFFLTACQTSIQPKVSTDNPRADKPTYYVYLAGPEVFLPDPIGAGEAKKATIAELNLKHDWPFTLVGLYPMDNEITNFKNDFTTGITIYKANVNLMQKANFVTANMVRFRGPSMDVGTAYEMGYMRGLGKPVFAYYDAKPFYGNDEKSGIYKDKVKKFYPMSKIKPHTDAFGQSVEDFNMADNLMMIGALEPTNREIATDFEKAILQIAHFINNKR